MIRIMFEPKTGININDPDSFRKIGDPYLEDFDAEFSGYIVVNANEFRLRRLEPLWQYIIRDETLMPDLIDYIKKNSVTEYTIHIRDY